jgi:hypothetical protein
MATPSASKQLRKVINRTSSQREAILHFLMSGNEISVKEAREAGIGNPAEVVSRLRNSGYEIYSNTRRTKNGAKVNRYRINVR